MIYLLGMHIVCHFRFDMYHDTFFQFSMRINDTNLHWKFLVNNGISPSVSKNVIYFYIDLFSNCTKFPIWGNFVEEDQCLVYFRLRIGKEHLKSSKMRRVGGVNDSINTFSIRYGYRLMEKNWYY